MAAQWQTLIQTKTTDAGMMKKKTNVAEIKMNNYKSSVCVFFLFLFLSMMCFVVDVNVLDL